VEGTVSARPAAPASPWRASIDIQNGLYILGPSVSPINVTSLSISTATASGSNINVYLYGDHVPSSATSCSGATFEVTLWRIIHVGDGVMPLSFSFPTPLQYKPLRKHGGVPVRVVDRLGHQHHDDERSRLLRRLTTKKRRRSGRARKKVRLLIPREQMGRSSSPIGYPAAPRWALL
jgi:hypothetical protein